MSRDPAEGIETSPTRWRAVKDMLFAALEVPTARRDQFLAAACAGDRDLEARVAALLRDNHTAGHTLEDSVRLLFGGEDRQDPLLGGCLGPYRLVRQLGEGGMGSVFLGLRDADFQMEVAVKVIKRGLDSSAAQAYFERERRIIAGLSHPYITRVLDGGSTADGRPYLIMEYVDGLPIDRYCDRMLPGAAGRLALFVKVCRAVDHAHRALIIHRDIKPANILVQADGTPKLLDFGIARFVEETEQAAGWTIDGQARMTPGYASPEQILGQSLTTATDVYSMGVLLFRLLTGRFPHRPAGTSYHQICNAVLEQEPRSPRAALADSESPPALTPVSPRELSTDLEAILMKALARRPGNRYGSVAEFALDLEHLAAGRPVSARPPTLRYLARKWVVRYWPRLSLAALVLLALIALLIEARLERRRAERQRAQAEELVTFMLEDLRGGLQSIGKLSLLAQVGNKAGEYFAGLSEEERTPAIIAKHILALYQIGEVQLENGQLDQAAQTFAGGMEQARRLVALAPNDKLANLRLAHGHYWLGLVAWYRGDHEPALTAFRAYHQVARTRAEAAPDDGEWLLEEAYGLTNIGAVLLQMGRRDEALDHYHRSVPIQERAMALDPTPAVRMEMAVALSWLGLLHERAFQPAEALAWLSRANDLTAELVREDPDNDIYRERHADQLTHLGRTYHQLEDHGAARRHQERALSIYLDRLGKDPANRTTRRAVLDLHHDLGRTLAELGDREGAERQYRAGLALYAERDSALSATRQVLIRMRIRLAAWALDGKRPAEAEPLLAAAESALAGELAEGCAGDLDLLAAELAIEAGRAQALANRPNEAARWRAWGRAQLSGRQDVDQARRHLWEALAITSGTSW